MAKKLKIEWEYEETPDSEKIPAEIYDFLLESQSEPEKEK